MNTQFTGSKRFIESFDSVRHVAREDYIERRIHAEIELMLSLLFGEPMVVPEPYSFDSLGFLYIATDVLDKRPRSRRNSPVWDPFVLALRERHANYRQMVGDLIRKKNFVLSAWPEITHDQHIREHLASCIEKGKYKEAKINFDAEKLERLEMLDGYFSEIDSCKAGPPSISLEDYINWIEEIDERAISQELEEYVKNLKKAIKNFRSKEINLTNRSDVRLNGKNLVAPHIFQAALEYIDSCYNRVVASSVGATTSIFSTREPGEYLHVRAGEELALHANLSKSADDAWYRLSLWITPEEDLRKRLKPLTKCWDKIWDIVTDDDWLQSVKKLHDALSSPSDNKRIEAEETLVKYINFLAKKLRPLTIKLENNWIKVIADPVGALAGEKIAKLLEYSFGWPLSPGTGAAIGVVLGRVTATGITKGKEWWAEGSIFRSLSGRVELR